MATTASKVQPRDRLARVLQEARDAGRAVVFTNGCFDILHAGHVHTLEVARGFGDLLVVGVNSDASVRRLKQTGRPLVPQEDRARVIAALACVDYVTIFEEDTPVETLELLRPSIHVKGGDYENVDIPERPVVERHGGVVRFVPFLPGRSTSGLVDRILGQRVDQGN